MIDMSHAFFFIFHMAQVIVIVHFKAVTREILKHCDVHNLRAIFLTPVLLALAELRGTEFLLFNQRKVLGRKIEVTFKLSQTRI